MKKIFLPVFALAGIACSTFAQKASAPNTIKLGFKVGTNYSNVFDSKTNQFNANAKFGVVVGAFVSMPFAEYFSFQPEVIFSQKGFRGSGSILGSPYQFTRTTDFIDIPLLFAVKPTKSVSILIGPQYAFLLKQVDEFTTTATSSVQQQEFENDNIRRNILSVLTGFDVTVKQLVLAARVGWDVQNNNGDGTSSTPRYKNVWYQVAIGFTL